MPETRALCRSVIPDVDNPLSRPSNMKPAEMPTKAMEHQEHHRNLDLGEGFLIESRF